MKYMGSKNRIAKYILPIVLDGRKDGELYWEPFVGGANLIDKVDGDRIGSDVSEQLIKALILIRDNPKSIPDVITEDDYESLKSCDSALSGFVSFAMSFGGKCWGGYRRDVAGTKGCAKNMETQTRRSKQSAIKQSAQLEGVTFVPVKYQEFTPPKGTRIYCDPPYAKATKYKSGGFDHVEFWQWCRDKATQGHKVFISEYNAPDDFVCVWQKEIVSSLTKNTGAKKGIEKLFVHKSQLDN